jgi:hypothetical protein
MAVMAAGSEGAAQTSHNDEFVLRSGTKLMLGGANFRYSGPNIEWLGIEAYGLDDSMGPRYPSHLEVDDVLDTAKMMGARVVRSQTMGDSVGCDLCLEPKAGVFNPEAFKVMDYAIKAAHERGLRLIVTLVGDCSNCEMAGEGEYLFRHGSAGAVVYSVQRRMGESRQWDTVCDRCATDADTPWVDADAAKSSIANLFATKYRVTAYNADGKASDPSAER